MLERYLTPDDVAEILSVNRRTVYIWLREGNLKGTKVGRSWRVSEPDLKSFVSGQEEEQPRNQEPDRQPIENLSRRDRRRLEREASKQK